jgi:cell division inhibitor SepF
MSAMRKIGEYLGLLEDTGVYDDEYDDQEYAEPQPVRRAPVPAKAPGAQAQPAPVADLSQRRRTSAPAPAAAGIAELSMITTLHPRTYNEARTVGENFREGIPVIINLSETRRAWSRAGSSTRAEPTTVDLRRRLATRVPVPRLGSDRGVR